MRKTIAELIDEISITNIKIYHLVEKIQNDQHTKEEAKKLQDLNKYRSELVNAINDYFGERKEVKI